MTKPIIRQGDVILIPVQGSVPQDAEAIPDDGSRIVLMHGEATGHAHAIYDHQESPESVVRKAIRKAQLYALTDGRRVLEVREPVTLKHEEHTAHEIPPGLYEVPIQVDMTTERMPRRVED